MLVVQDLLRQYQVQPWETETALADKWRNSTKDLDQANQILEELLGAVRQGTQSLSAVSLLVTYAFSALIQHRRLVRAITVTSIAPAASPSAYTDCPSPFEPRPAGAPAAASASSTQEEDPDRESLAMWVVQIVETFYLASAEQAESHRRALCVSAQGMQILGGILRAYAVALVEVLKLPGAGARCVGFLQHAVEGLAHRRAALSVAHATLIHVVRQAGLPVAALRLVRPVMSVETTDDRLSLPVLVDVGSPETGTALADYAAFYVEAALFWASQGRWVEATQCVYNVVTLHEGECFGSVWNGTEVGVDWKNALKAINSRASYSGMERGRPDARGTGRPAWDDVHDDYDDSDPEDDAWLAPHAPRDGAVGRASVPAPASLSPAPSTMGSAIPTETRVVPNGLRDVGRAVWDSRQRRTINPTPSRLEAQVAYDLFLQAVKLCYVLLVIAHGGGQPRRVVQLVDHINDCVRKSQKLKTDARAAANAKGGDGAAVPAERRRSVTDPGDPSEGLHSAADDPGFTRSHMNIEKIVLAGTRLDAFSSMSDRRLTDDRGALNDLGRFPATAALLASLAPYRTLLCCAARRDLVGWTLAMRQYDVIMSRDGVGHLLVVATSALRRHIVVDMAHTYDVVYLRDILLRIASHESDPKMPTTTPATTTTTTRANPNQVQAALQLLREMHESGQIECHLESPKDTRDEGAYVVHLSTPPLTAVGVTGSQRPPHGYFCLAPPLHAVDLKPSLVERTEYMHRLRSHLALVKEVDFMQWHQANARPA